MSSRWAVLLIGASLAFACASSTEVGHSDRWESYPGCNARQCQAWYDECVAECINTREVTVTECQTRCQARVPQCEAACPN